MAIVLMWVFFIVVAIGIFSLLGNFILGVFHALGKALPTIFGSIAVVVIVILIICALCR